MSRASAILRRVLKWGLVPPASKAHIVRTVTSAFRASSSWEMRRLIRSRWMKVPRSSLSMVTFYQVAVTESRQSEGEWETFFPVITSAYGESFL
jgi:hypothetical protein